MNYISKKKTEGQIGLGLLFADDGSKTMAFESHRPDCSLIFNLQALWPWTSYLIALSITSLYNGAVSSTSLLLCEDKVESNTSSMKLLLSPRPWAG